MGHVLCFGARPHSTKKSVPFTQFVIKITNTGQQCLCQRLEATIYDQKYIWEQWEGRSSVHGSGSSWPPQLRRMHWRARWWKGYSRRHRLAAFIVSFPIDINLWSWTGDSPEVVFNRTWFLQMELLTLEFCTQQSSPMQLSSMYHATYLWPSLAKSVVIELPISHARPWVDTVSMVVSILYQETGINGDTLNCTGSQRPTWRVTTGQTIVWRSDASQRVTHLEDRNCGV